MQRVGEQMHLNHQKMFTIGGKQLPRNSAASRGRFMTTCEKITGGSLAKRFCINFRPSSLLTCNASMSAKPLIIATTKES